MPAKSIVYILRTHKCHTNITHFSQQLQNLIVAHQLDSKPRTPIKLHTLRTELALHPDWTFVSQLIHNLQYGCNIGYTGPQFAHCSNNLPSSFQHPSTLDANIIAECDKGHILGPFKTPPLLNFRCSGLGLVPKHDGGWRAIYHLSAPYGSSINDSIDPEAYTLTYLLSNYQSLGVAQSTHRTYQAGVRALQQFCTQYAVVPFPASPLTLRYFCCYMACQVLYKTIQVYLAGIQLEHLERGLEDPTKDELLQLLCTGIKRSQGVSKHNRLPVTINVLQTLKSQLRHDPSFSPLEKQLLWWAALP